MNAKQLTLTLALALSSLAQGAPYPYAFSTLAGMASPPGSDGIGSGALFSGPNGVAVDSAGNVYVADTGNDTIRRIEPGGVVTTVAGLAGPGAWGSTDGTGSAARFYWPSGVAVDSAGNVLVADTANNTIRRIGSGGVVTTVAGLAGAWGTADGNGSTARFFGPAGIAADGAGNVYVADAYTIRKLGPGGVVTTLAGLGGSYGSADGTGSVARFHSPGGVAVDSAGNVYVADTWNHTIREIGPGGLVTTLAGLAGTVGSADGTGSVARFHWPGGVAVDSAGNVYVADSWNHTIRRIGPGAVVTTVAGLARTWGSADGTGSLARFNRPTGLAIDSAGTVYVADTDNQMIRRIGAGGVVTTVAGVPPSADGTGSAARFASPEGVAVDSADNVFVADTGNDMIRKIGPGGVVTTVAGWAWNWSGADGRGPLNSPSGVAVDSAGNVYVVDVYDFWRNLHGIKKIGPGGVVTNFAQLGEDYATVGVAVDRAGNVYVADTEYSMIREIGPGGAVTAVAGSSSIAGSADGTGSAARFNWPTGLAVDSAGTVYVADTDNQTIRQIAPGGAVTTLAGLAGNSGSVDGTGSAARFSFPQGVAVDSLGNVYVADTGNQTIRKIGLGGVVMTVAGLAGNPGSSDGTGSAVRFNHPTGVAVDSAGNLYVADTGNNTIRKGFPAPMILATNPDFGFQGSQFGFNFTGPRGQSAVVEASSDLVNWLPLWTNTITDTLNFTDPQSGAFSHRFYRLHLP